jgi:hypothetical protein
MRLEGKVARYQIGKISADRSIAKEGCMCHQRLTWNALKSGRYRRGVARRHVKRICRRKSVENMIKQLKTFGW